MKWPYFIIGCALAIFGAFVRILDPEPLPQLREGYFDLLQRSAPRIAQDSVVEIVAIDEASLQALGQWPWPRNILADLTNRLNEAGAAVVSFDVLFAEQDRFGLGKLLQDEKLAFALGQTYAPAELEALDSDQQFADALSGLPTVLATSRTTFGPGQRYEKAGFITYGQQVLEVIPDTGNLTDVLPPLQDPASGIGVINMSAQDETGIVRQVPLLWQSHGGIRPALSIETLRVALGEATFLISASSDLKGVVQGVQVGELLFPTDSQGALRVHYTPQAADGFISAIDVLNAPLTGLKAQVSGKIILVGATAPGLFDARTSVLGESVPGVSIHKQIIDQGLQGAFLVRTDLQIAIEILIFLLLSVVAAIAVSLKRASVTIISGVGSALVIVLASYLGFTQRGVLFDVTFLLFGGFVNLTLLGGYQFIVLDRDKRRLRRSFEHYVAPNVLTQIESADYKVGLSGENRDITVMFADLRGFTRYSEVQDPQHVVSVLNALFTRFTDQILATNGTVDKFVGDGVMAFWNAPMPVSDHKLHGLRTALGLRAVLSKFNSEQTAKGQEPVSMALGLSSGIACVGNIGSDQRFSYTAIGKTVNLAARIESACREINYDIVTTVDTARSTDLAWLPAGAFELKGFHTALPLCVVVGNEDLAKSPEFQTLFTEVERLIAAKGDEGANSKARALELSSQIDPNLAGFITALANRSL